MRTSYNLSRSILTLGLLCSSSLVFSFPLIRTPFGSLEIAETRQELKRSPQGYSVVPVGGTTTSASASASASTLASGPTATVTDAVTHIQTSLVMSTVTAVPNTIQTTATVTAMSTIQTSATVTVLDTIQPSVTSVPYDNGMWHTTYYFRSTITPGAAGGGQLDVATVSSSAATSTTAITDPGQWAPWASKMGGPS